MYSIDPESVAAIDTFHPSQGTEETQVMGGPMLLHTFPIAVYCTDLDDRAQGIFSDSRSCQNIHHRKP